jgi:hypothetical protein
MNTSKKCKVEGCDRDLIAKGLCNSHYKRWKYGRGIAAHRPIGVRPSGSEHHNCVGREWISGGRTFVFDPMWQEHGRKHKYIRKARAVMEAFLGRKLERDEQVHHINRNKLDDRIENLQLMSTADHARLHWECGETRPCGEPGFLSGAKRDKLGRLLKGWKPTTQNDNTKKTNN